MLTTLVESRRARDRSFGGTAISVAVHAVLIAVVAAVTVRASPAPDTGAEVIDAIYFPQAEPESSDSPAGGETSVPRPADVQSELPALDVPDDALPGLPAPPSPGLPLDDITFGGSERAGDTREATAGQPVGGEAQVHFEWMVDVPATGRRGNPTPIYPRPLREASIEGAVLAQFVIGTDGRADMSTFRALTSSHELFEAAVGDAVARMRFTPAESGGRRVRVLVQQSFAFRIER